MHLVALVVLAGLARAGEIPLPASDPAYWSRLVFVEGSEVAEADACVFTTTRDGERDCLVVGPWRAGAWSARWQAAKPVARTRGSIRGFYRTEGSAVAEVSCVFFGAGKKMRRDDFGLAPAAAWTPFEVALRRAPRAADGAAPAFGLSAHTEGRAWFAGLSLIDDIRRRVFPATPAALNRPAPPAALSPGKRFRLERSGDAWWLVTPAGRPFYSAGTDAPGFKEAAEGAAMAAAMRSMGFNSLGGWSNVWRWGPVNDSLVAKGEPPFATFVAIETSDLPGCGRLLDPAEEDPRSDHAFPDPFDPAFEPGYRKLVADVAGVAAGKPWLAGWFIDNERDHGRLDRRVWSGHAGRTFLARLKERYRSVERLNAAWGTSFASFAGMAEKRPVAGLAQGPLFEDCREFTRELVKRYAATAARTVREADPGALVFSNRFMLSSVDDTLSYLGAYAPVCDGIAVNIYPRNQSPGLAEDERTILARFHEISGKPVLITEWSVPALDSGLYDDDANLDWSFPEAVETQADRGRQAACVTADFYNLSFVVGAHWFTWRDFDSGKRKANRGLFRSNGEPWRELRAALAGVHGRLPGVRFP